MGSQPAAESAQAAGLLVNDDVIQQMEGISRAAGVAVLVLTVVVAILGGLALWNIKVIQELRAFQKVAEIGMLKAIGMSNGLLRQVYLAEATLIWLLGLGGGVVLGIGAGLLIAWHLGEDAEDRFTAFSCPWYLLLGVVGLGGLVCWLSTLWGTRSARRASPIETLSAP